MIFLEKNTIQIRVNQVLLTHLDTAQTGAVREVRTPEAVNVFSNGYAGQASAMREVSSSSGNAVGDRDARQAGAQTEGLIPDTRDAVGNCDAGQFLAAPKGSTRDADNTFRYCVTDARLPSRIKKQNASFFVEQDTVHAFVIQTTRPNNDGCQRGATEEGAFPDAGNLVRNRDAGQARATRKGFRPDAGNAITNRNSGQACAFRKGTSSDACNALRNCDAGQACAFFKDSLSDTGDSFALDV